MIKCWEKYFYYSTSSASMEPSLGRLGGGGPPGPLRPASCCSSCWSWRGYAPSAGPRPSSGGGVDRSEEVRSAAGQRGGSVAAHTLPPQGSGAPHHSVCPRWRGAPPPSGPPAGRTSGQPPGRRSLAEKGQSSQNCSLQRPSASLSAFCGNQDDCAASGRSKCSIR